MKTTNLFSFLLLFFLLFSSTISADDSCPSGMRKTYVDDLNMKEYGSARSWLGAVCYFQFPGSLFFSRQVLIEPRFEVHLKSTVDAIEAVESSDEQKIYGYTIVISGYKNTISGLEGRSVSSGSSSSLTFTDIGYNNFVNALIIEFDFVEDLYDPSANSFSIKYCDTYCHSYDNNAIITQSLSNQKYIPGQKNEWDFRFVYEDKKITLYSGPNTILYQKTYDLEETLGTNIAYVGFTGFMESNRAEINLMGTFMCEDNYAINKMKGSFYKNGKLYEEMTYEPGQTISFAFKFINTQGNVVPHTYGYKIWDYSFFVTQDCDSEGSYTITKLDNYTLILTISACSTIGTHTININEDTKGSGQETSYTVIPGPMKIIEIVGHDGLIGEVPMKSVTDVFYLNYGEGISGDFILKENLNIVLDLQISDQYGNKVEVSSPGTLFTLKKVNIDGSTSNVNTNIINYNLTENGDYYQMIISVAEIGTYQIEKNDYMEKAIRFDVIPAEPSATNSYCELYGYTSVPTVKIGTQFSYICYLRDIDGNDIQINTFIQNSKYEFICSLDKSWPSSASYNPSVYSGVTSYFCNYTSSEVGNFAYNAYFRLKSTKETTKITSKINQFKVRGYANTYTIKKIFNPNTKTWIDIDTYLNTQITYTSDSSGFITAIDFAESDGSVLISSYDSYPNDFNLDNLKVKFYSPHDELYNFAQPYAKMITMNGKYYIGIYTQDETSTNNLFKKSSFNYYLQFNYTKESSYEEKSSAIKYVLNIGTYMTCFHNLKEEYAKITISDSINVLTGGSEVKLGTIVLSTIDYYLYNNDIGVDNIKFYPHPDNDNIMFRFVPLSIEGTYDVYVQSNQNHYGTIELTINNKSVKNFTFVSEPPKACYLTWINYEGNYNYIKSEGKQIYYEYVGDFDEGNLLIGFYLYDKNDKYIENADYFITYNDISSEEYGADTNYYNITYDPNNKYYIFRDNIPYSDYQRGWSFTMRDSTCNNIYYVRYDGSRGGSPLDVEQSYFTLLNTEIYIKNEAFVDVIYKDKNGQLFGLQGDKLSAVQKNTKVTAVNYEGYSVILDYYETTSNYALRYKSNFTISGIYLISVLFEDNHKLKYEKTNQLNVIDNIYNLTNSKLKMITNNIAEMSTTSRTTIDNKMYRPNFRLYFYTKDNLKTDYDKNINFQLIMNSNDMSRPINFNVNKNNDEFVQFNFPEEDDTYFDILKRGDYNLELQDDKNKVNYPIYLTGDNYTDSSNEEFYDISKTEVNPILIDGIAGKTYTINIEFRAKDGLRWNYLVDTSQFKISYSQDGLKPGEISFKTDNGPKKGQVVILVTQTKALNENVLTFTYKNDKISQGVTLNIKCNELNNLKLIEGPTIGNVINPPIIKFEPLDIYGNLYTDLFSSTITQKEINSLTVGASKDNVALTDNNYLSDNKYLIVQYISKITTDVIVTSDFFKETHEYRIYSGPIDKETSFAEVISSTTEVDGEYTLLITPKDLYNNNIDNLNDSHLQDFTVYYRTLGTNEKYDDVQCYLIEKSSNDNLRILFEESQDNIKSSYTNIQCKANITKAGTLQFVVEYKTDSIYCKNQCTFMVVPTTILFSNTKTYYTNKNVYLSTKTQNSVDIGTNPTFEVSFYDPYLNQLDSLTVNKIQISAELEGTDVKLCVSNDGKIKTVTICPTSNGDDNENKWSYLTNGDNYFLKIYNDINIIKYPISITGGASDGSSDNADFNKTKLEPMTLNLVAGEEGKFLIEIRTKNEERKNYWYPEPSEKIDIKFVNDEDTCSSSVEKARLPGQYYIKVICTKTNNNNSIKIALEENELKENVKLTVVSSSAYYLEVIDLDKFSASSDRYNWKENPSNDDLINFNFKLKDKYQNYITDNLINSGQFTISSETYDSANSYYSLEFMPSGYSYLFTDKINEVITKHTWNIFIVDSNRKYSFIYNKVPGVPDLSKSYWIIDKTSYILKETSTVSIYLLDRLGVNLGIIDGNLNTEKEKLQVITNNGNNAYYTYSSLNSDNIKYTYKYESIGDYKVSVFYNSQLIGEKKDINVAYQNVDLKTSKLYYNIDNVNDNLMLTSVQTNIDNLKDYPFYKFLLYTSSGDRITLYDKSINMKCKMIFGINEWEMVVTKLDDYINIEYQSNFKETFSKLPLGLYNIEITYGNDIIKYPLYLLGEVDVSPSSEYDLSKIYIKPTEIEAMAGEEKEVEIEFRASDGLRYNYDINLLSFGITNSYKLSDTQLQIQKVKGEKSGQIILKINQTVSTNIKPNILSLTYSSKKISQTISLTIKSSSLNKLVYQDGCKDGTVINPPTLIFIPYDQYGNLCTDISDSNKYPQDKLNSLLTGISLDGYGVTSSIYTLGGNLYVLYGCTSVTTIQITSEYFPETYKYKLYSGPIDPRYTYAEVVKYQDVIAGDITTINIYPKDINKNNVSSISEDDLTNFEVFYNIDEDSSVTISDDCKIVEGQFNYISCKANITKSGDIDFGVDYSNSAVDCYNCEFNISPDTLDFSKTKVVNQNNNKEMSKITTNTLTITNNPKFNLSFYDRFMNAIINKNEVENLVVSTTIEITDVLLCIENNNLNKISSLCKNNNDENEEKWKYIPSGDSYNLKVTSKNEDLIYPLSIIGGYTDGEAGPIDISKTYINPTSLTLTAGIEGSISLELRTENDNRKNYWFKDPKKYLDVIFPENAQDCIYILEQGSKPGQYLFKFTCKEKKDTFQSTILVNKIEVPQKVSMKVIPNIPTWSKLFSTNGVEITKRDLGKVSVESKYQMINKLYDEYNNLITSSDIDLSILKLKIAPSVSVKNYEYSIDSVIQKNGEITITVKSTFAGEHIIVGALLPLSNYTITFTHGEPSADNSILEVSTKEAYVGETIKIYITPYDKYFNLIDANEYKETSPYQVKYTSEGSTTKVITEKHSIETVNNINVISYPGTFYVRGYTNFAGYLDTNQIKCVTCRIDIKSRDVDFKNSIAMRYDSTKKDYEILKDGVIEKNAQEEPIYRLYPRDQYLNTIDYIPEEKLKTYRAYLQSQKYSITYNLKLNNKEYTNQPYAEFVINDDDSLEYTYATLVQGYYYLIFTDDNDNIQFNITLLGDGKGGSNADVDYQKTHINEQNLVFKAGESGYIVLEMRTIHDERKNYWGYNIEVKSCNENDDTFKAESTKSGLRGVYQIIITTKLANTYPSLVKCPLKIYVENELVKDLSPEMEVSPNTVVKTKILEEYYKEQSDTDLLDGNADNNYIFEVASYDQYHNFAETIQETIGLKVTLKGGSEITKITSVNVEETGYRKYSIPANKIGTYIVSTSKSGSQGIYLKKDANFLIKPGAIDLSKTIIKVKVTPIQAGNKPAISIVAFDKYENQLEYDKYKDKFNTVFIDANNQEFDSDSSYDSGVMKVFYTSKDVVTIVGDTKVEVTYDGTEKIDTSEIIITIIPGEPDPQNSILSRKTSSGEFIEYANESSFIIDPSETLKLNITLYDKYKNYISELPVNSSVKYPIMSGNKMKEIDFTVTKNAGNFDLSFEDNAQYVHIYQHLVKGKYNLDLLVSSSLGNAKFHYNMIINTGDNLHGNGDYDISKCVLLPSELSFIAGNYEKFTLELRTSNGLLYNDDIDLTNDININNGNADDKSFKSSIEKTGTDYGIYTINIYSEKKGEYNLNVELKDPSSNKEEKSSINPAKYKVTPHPIPCKNFTQLISQPDSTISIDTKITLTFELYDKFNNKMEDSDKIININYLTLYNNELPYSYTSLNFDTRVDLTLMPKYPPKVMLINLLYNNGETSVYIFEKDIEITIESEIDYGKTLIVSKNKEKIYAGELLDMQLYTYDKSYKCYENGDLSAQFKIEVTGPLDSSKQFVKTYQIRKTATLKYTSSDCDNEYEIITKDEDKYIYAGNYIIKVMYGKDNLIAQYNQVCYPLGYSLDGFYLTYTFNPDSISILDSPSFTLTGSDEYGNTVTDPLYNDISISFTNNNENIDFETKQKLESQQGTLNYQVSIQIVGSHQLHIFYKNQEVNVVNGGQPLPIFTIVTGPCYANDTSHFDLTPLNDAEVSLKTHFTFYCYDKFNNKITKGGESFTVRADYLSNTNQGNIISLDNAKVVDNGDGSYNVEFVPSMKGIYLFNILIGKEKYGQEVRWELTAFSCSEENSIVCPNKKECVSDISECIDPDKRCNDTSISSEKPFYCKVNGVETCTKSQTDCDCPNGYYKCKIMNYCVPEDRKDMCPVFKNLLLYCINNNMKYNFDGICRKENNGPNQRVCPIGKVLCADLSCRDSYNQCVVTEIRSGLSQRCIGQQIVTSATLCPSSITCSTESEVVCPSGDCVSNEIYCPTLNKCNDNYPYLCQNNACAEKFENCPPSISCGENKLLCSDNICREKC